MPESDRLKRLLADLTRPQAYPDLPSPASRPERIETLQTHASVIFFAGDRVYKVKKPVDYGFLDFSTLEKRRHFCREEVRLNRRLAPRMYLDVRAIVEDAGGRLRIAGEDEDRAPIEYAVEMLRLPADRMLDALLERDEVETSQIKRLVEVLARFHAEAETGDEIDAFGAPDAVRTRIMDNLSECRPFAGEIAHDESPQSPTIAAPLLDRLRRWTSDRIDASDPLIAERMRSGRVREGHGDLHAGNICMLDDEVVIYDCIEFQRSFRCADVASDMAFLAMDLDRRGHPELATDLIERYARAADDPAITALQSLYRAHFACVRGKVDSLRAREKELDDAKRLNAWRSATESFALAAGYIIGPALILMCGLPGSGKSWVAEPLAQALRARLLRSDVVRKELLGCAPTDRPGAHAYDGDITDRTYAELRAQAALELKNGRSVVVDATFTRRDRREAMLDLRRPAPTAKGAADHSTLVVHVDPPEKVILARLRKRAEDASSVSDADERVYRKIRDRFEPPTEIAPERRIRLDGEGSRALATMSVLERLAEVAAPGAVRGAGMG